jgi:hypothetical protein
MWMMKPASLREGLHGAPHASERLLGRPKAPGTDASKQTTQSRPKRQDRPSKPQHHSLKDPLRTQNEASRHRLFKAGLQEAERVPPPIKSQNTTEARRAAHNTPSDGRRRAHGGPEPAPEHHHTGAS